MIADLEGPSFISRTVAHRRMDGRGPSADPEEKRGPCE
jgi:hypothetical protein